MTKAKIEAVGSVAGGVETRLPIERIRERAYELWERNHRPPGLEAQFWALAEQELRAETAAAHDVEGG